jgi:hypothetical protein
MAERREFPQLLRRKRYLEQELYTYDKYLRRDETDPKQQTRWALDAETNNEELNEIDYVLRYFERLGNGYHLSRRQWLLLVSLAGLAIVLGVIAVVR